MQLTGTDSEHFCCRVLFLLRGAGAIGKFFLSSWEEGAFLENFCPGLKNGAKSAVYLPGRRSENGMRCTCRPGRERLHM
jgi:hypothetical protein